jgi:hypothetical protein
LGFVFDLFEKPGQFLRDLGGLLSESPLILIQIALGQAEGVSRQVQGQ